MQGNQGTYRCLIISSSFCIYLEERQYLVRLMNGKPKQRLGQLDKEPRLPMFEPALSTVARC